MRLFFASLRLLSDGALLLRDLILQVFDAGSIGSQVRLSGLKRSPIIGLVNARKHLACAHGLVILHQHCRKVAGDLWTDDDGIGLNGGVVGRDQESPCGPVIAPIKAHGPEHEHGGRSEEDAPPAAASARFCR
jgi:hypothetical protein